MPLERLAKPSLLLVLLLLSGASAQAIDWRWRMPSPTGEWFNAVAGNGRTAIAVGTFGALATTTNGLDWSMGHSFCTNDLFGAVCPEGQPFVVCGGDGAVFYSIDAAAWKRTETPTAHTLSALAFGDGKFVAVGAGGTAVSTTNLVDWVAAAPFTDRWLLGVAYGNGLFVAVSSFGFIYTSPNGITWNEQLALASKAWISGVEFINGVFVAVDYDGVAHRSTDGWEWLSFETGAHSTLTNVRRIRTSNGDEFLATALNGNTYASMDGMTWRNWGAIPGNAWGAGVTVNGFIAAVGSGGVISVARNLPGWIGVSPRRPSIPGGISDFAIGNGLFMAAHHNGILTSPNLRDWDLVAQANFVTSVAYGNGEFTASYNGGKLMSSSDGVTWRDVADFSPVNLMSIRFAKDKFLSVGSSSIIVSNDGRTWREIQIPASYLTDVTYGNGVWVATDAGGVWVSSDAENWEFAPVDLEPALFTICYGNGLFVAAGQNNSAFTAGTVYTSEDGRNWTQRLNVGRFGAATFGDGTFLVAGDFGVVWRSQNGIDWQVEPRTLIDSVQAVAIHGGIALLGMYGSIVSGEIESGVADETAILKLFPELNSVGLKFKTRFGVRYRLQRSSDLQSWTDFRTPFDGDGGVDYQLFSMGASEPQFFRYAIEQ